MFIELCKYFNDGSFRDKASASTGFPAVKQLGWRCRGTWPSPVGAAEGHRAPAWMGGGSRATVRGWSWLPHGVWPASRWLVALQVGLAAWDRKDHLLGMAVGVGDQYRAGLGAWRPAGSGAAWRCEPRRCQQDAEPQAFARRVEAVPAVGGGGSSAVAAPAARSRWTQRLPGGCGMRRDIFRALARVLESQASSM